jgi:D-alanyl-D-alanine endopeptidase (penicillin-binding protein 7)
VSIDLDPLLGQWATHLFCAAWQSAVAAAVILTAVRVLSLSARTRQALFLIVLIKFALPPMLAFPTGLFSAVGPVDIAADRPSFLLWLAVVYGAGVLVAGVRLFAEMRTITRIRRDSRPADGSLLDELRESLGVRRPVALRTSSEITVPFACGLIRPEIIIPAGLTGEDDLRSILAHELAHIRRLDLPVQWLGAVLGVLWWFHPLLPLVRRRLHAASEECCDDLAIAGGGITAEGYSRSLVAVAAGASQRAWGWVAAMSGETDSLRERILRLSKADQAHRGKLQWILVLVAALALLPGVRISAERLLPRFRIEALPVHDHAAGHQHSHSH